MEGENLKEIWRGRDGRREVGCYTVDERRVYHRLQKSGVSPPLYMMHRMAKTLAERASWQVFQHIHLVNKNLQIEDE
jgi:hypothetical protein